MVGEVGVGEKTGKVFHGWKRGSKNGYFLNDPYVQTPKLTFRKNKDRTNTTTIWTVSLTYNEKNIVKGKENTKLATPFGT